jgi:hypothetical protein
MLLHLVRVSQDISQKSLEALQQQFKQPDNINVPNQHKTKCTRVLSIDEFLRIPQEHIHVRIDAFQLALVLCLAPLETDDKLGADPRMLY